jgi:hypothetical protein
MSAVTTGICQVKRGLFRCDEKAAGLCQYCGRLFCRKHGVFLEENQEVCNRKFCVAKREDLARHLTYKSAVMTRNETRLCGIEVCEHGISEQCARCKGYFCGMHVIAREEMIVENQVRVRRMATLCRHCWERRPIWTRT